MRFSQLIKFALPLAVLISHSAWADTLSLNYERTASNLNPPAISTVVTALELSKSYDYSRTVIDGSTVSSSLGTQNGNGFGFVDDYIFSIGPSLISNSVTSIDFNNIVGIQNFEVRLIQVTDASQAGPTGGASIIQGWTQALSCGATPSGLCTAYLNIIPTTSLNAGYTYDLQIRGTTEINGGSFGGVLNTAPVPLPAAFPLLLSALGLLSGAVRRQK